MLQPLIHFCKVLFAIVRHRLFIRPVVDDPKYGDQYNIQVTEFKPAIRKNLCSQPSPKKLIAAKKTFAPPEWCRDAHDHTIELWRNFILNRPENYCAPKIKNPLNKTLKREGSHLRVA